MPVLSAQSGSISPDTITKELNFDPYEDIGIPNYLIDLPTLQFANCLPIETVFPPPKDHGFPGWYARTFIKNKKIKIQECYPDSYQVGKIIVATYYDEKAKTRAPVAFVLAVEADSDKDTHNGIWGKVNDGFVSSGRPTKVWRDIFPTKEKSVQDQLEDLLIKSLGKLIH